MIVTASVDARTEATPQAQVSASPKTQGQKIDIQAKGDDCGLVVFHDSGTRVFVGSIFNQATAPTTDMMAMGTRGAL